VRLNITQNGEHALNDLFLKTYLKIRDLMTREEAQDLVEYALLITLVSLAAVGGIRKVTSAINTVFTNISNTLS
jgi:pilus assembly protein Flp/PilA